MVDITNFAVYKIKQLNASNHVTNIYVFGGPAMTSDLFSKNPYDTIFSAAFNKADIDDIMAQNINVFFIDEYIRIDDNIHTVKIKIAQAINTLYETNNQIAIQKKIVTPEIFAFILRKHTINVKNIVQKIQKNGRIEQLYVNMYLTTQLPSKLKSYPRLVDDTSEMTLYDKIIHIKHNTVNPALAVPLGYPSMTENFDFTTNPFSPDKYNITDIDVNKLLYKIKIYDTNVVFQSGDVINNDIYICLGSDVLKNINTSNADIKLYYPIFGTEQIYTLSKFDEKYQQLLTNTDKEIVQLSPVTRNVNLFYGMYKNKTPSDVFSLEFQNISFLKIEMVYEYKIHVPLDIIFKTIHATKTHPFIKYNLGSTKQSIYRLYTDKLTDDGRKVPFFNRPQLLKLVKDIGRTSNTVTIYSIVEHDEKEHNIICEFKENGNIVIYSDIYSNLTVPINSSTQIDELFKLAVNPLLDQIAPIFEQSGFEMHEFVSLTQHNINIIDMTYQSQYKVKKKINISKIMGCASSIFVDEITTDDLIELRCKRVSNFSQSDSIEIFIVQKILKNFNYAQIVQELMENFNFSEEKGRQKLNDILENFNITQEMLGKKYMRKITNYNPGFKVIINVSKQTSRILITINDINDINYLETLPIYINTLVRLIQDPSSTTYTTSKNISAQCKTIAQQAASVQSDIQKRIFDEKMIAAEMGDENVEEIEDNMDELFNLIGYEDEEDEEDEEYNQHGGDDDSASVESIILSDEEGDEEEEDEEDEEGDEKEEDEEEDKNEEKSNTTQQKNNNNDDYIHDIVGTKLHYPNIFAMRIKEKLPAMFVRTKDEKISQYSRMVQNNRIPIILDEEEKQEYQKDHPDLEPADILEYGSDSSNSSNKYYFICPKYWCLLTNKPVTEEDIRNGKCGKNTNLKDAIIPAKADKVPKNKFVYKFYDNIPNPKTGIIDADNKKKYPGFHKTISNESGMCYPQCLIKWNTPEAKSRIKKCKEMLYDKETIKENDKKEPATEKTSKKQHKLAKCVISESVLAPTKFPIAKNKWGYLPPTFKHFLGQLPHTDGSIYPVPDTILRHGVENSAFQSFIACIADIMFFCMTNNTSAKNPLITKYISNPTSNVPSIDEMKQIIISAIDLDSYITYQNGDLVTTFLPSRDVTTLPVNTEEYKSTKLYKSVKGGNIDNKRAFLENAIRSFENFKMFLLNPKTYIDGTYLWDIICLPNPKLFPRGVNLIIFEIPNDDSSNNIELLCPTNHYSLHTFNPKLNSIILIKQDKYFEPIYVKKPMTAKRELSISRLFNEKGKTTPETIRAIFPNIVNFIMTKKCGAFPSIKTYKFKQPILLDVLIEQLISNNYIIIEQISNFNGKIIGVIAKNKTHQGFLPCYPSSVTDIKNIKCNDDTTCDIPVIYISDVNWYSYANTVAFLKNFYSKIKDTQPFYNVVDKEFIIGLLTNSNQFIEISSPIKVSDADATVPSVTDYNYLTANINTSPTISNTTQHDIKRIKFVKRIQLETSFFNIFRNTVRILLNKYVNNKLKKQIQSECNNSFGLYTDQLKTVIKLLNDLVGNNIIFAQKPDDFYDSITEHQLYNCLNKSQNKCANNIMCNFAGEMCTLILPKNNLITKSNNEQIYFAKMADQLIRYDRIKSFMFNPHVYLSFDNVGYNLNSDEIIILQDLLVDQTMDSVFWNTLDTSTGATNNAHYIKNSTYDTAKPLQSIVYDDTINI